MTILQNRFGWAARGGLASFALVTVGALGAHAAQVQQERAGALDAAAAEVRWALEIQPLAERFETASEVRLLLTVRNVSSEARTISLPFAAGAAWPQWVDVARGDVRLEPAADYDFAAEPASLAAGEQMSVLVGLEPFLSAEAFAAAGPGSYSLRWEGGTIGFAASASAVFEVTGAPLAGAAPGSLESFLPPLRDAEPFAERVRAAWLRFASSASDPRLIAFAAVVPAERIDVLAAFEILEETRDLGVRRALVQLLGRVGRDELAAERLIEFLRRHPDPSLASLGSEALDHLR